MLFSEQTEATCAAYTMGGGTSVQRDDATTAEARPSRCRGLFLDSFPDFHFFFGCIFYLGSGLQSL
jgi:hypothetical protein